MTDIVIANTPEKIEQLLEGRVVKSADEINGPMVVYGNVNVGDSLIKGVTGGERYILHIDSDQIIGRFQDTKKILRYIKELFPENAGDSFYSKHGVHENNDVRLPLTKLLEAKVGDCLEMSVIFQFYAQAKGQKSYIVSGYVNEDAGFSTLHTFNVIRKDGQYVLFDIAGGFFSPILAITKSQKGTLSFVTRDKCDATYSLN
ncbi:hypothetical protein JXA85_05600 [Candidatus Woesearchaeota archaeon]|nr:hypothetical protein [Candidatus Woesearchaeota archaeon]